MQVNQSNGRTNIVARVVKTCLHKILCVNFHYQFTDSLVPIACHIPHFLFLSYILESLIFPLTFIFACFNFVDFGSWDNLDELNLSTNKITLIPGLCSYFINIYELLLIVNYIDFRFEYTVKSTIVDKHPNKRFNTR